MMSRALFFACLVLLLPLTGCMTPLGRAAMDGDTKAVLAQLDQGVDINASVQPNGSSALHLAVCGGHIETVRALLDRGADVNRQNPNYRWTPLHEAAWEGCRGSAEMVQLLLNRGADTTVLRASCAVCKDKTPLDDAQEKGDPKIIWLIKQAEAKQLAVLQQGSQLVTSLPLPAAPVMSSDVDRLPTVKAVSKKNAFAVVIGIEQYREKLPKADFADRDAKLVGEYLTKVLGYPEENVIVQVNERATGRDLEKYFENWLPNNVEKDGTVFIYYSGHGSPNPKTGDAYLVPYDGDPGFLETTGYPLKRLFAALEKLPVKDVTVVLDSCFSGAGGRSVIAQGLRPMGLSAEHAIKAPGRTVVLSASSGEQVSSTYLNQGHGLLTYYFLKGLQGDGDLNKDGSIELAELYEYVKPNVQKVARKQYNNEQTPQLLASPDVLKKGGGRLLERTKP